MVRKVKGSSRFVTSDSNITPDSTLSDIVALKEKTDHSTIAVTDNGLPNGKLLGYRDIQRLPIKQRPSK